MRSRILLAVVVLIAALGCHRRAPPLPDLTFTSFGRADPSGDAHVVRRWKNDRGILLRNAQDPAQKVKKASGEVATAGELAKDPIARVKGIEVLVDTFPSGLVVEKNSAHVEDGSGLALKGKFTIEYRKARPMEEALDDVRVLAAAAEGKLAVVSWLRHSQTHVNGVVGVVLDLSAGELDRSKLKSGTITEL